jgi:hypothetical protein
MDTGVEEFEGRGEECHDWLRPWRLADTLGPPVYDAHRIFNSRPCSAQSLRYKLIRF